SDKAQMWELSSPSEAAKAAAQARIRCLTHRFRSLAKARQLPQGIGFVAWVLVSRATASNADFASDKAQMWELSSPSEAAKAAAQARIRCLTHRFRSLAKARQLPQWIGFVAYVLVSRAIASNADFASDKAQMWELSSPSEAAKTAAQAIYKVPDPPLSQPC
ncbi:MULTISPECIES: hypothetical protein, partial [unclassified Pseudomonas]|uniref:hypothetical protein n=1 Tax=unclassified Pseudomonas TaxID=196821 RepID=UPI001F16DDBD